MITKRLLLLCAFAGLAICLVPAATAQNEPADAPSTVKARTEGAILQGEAPPAPAADQLSPEERARRELERQKKQRLFRIIPDFNTSNVANAAPLTPRQKFRLWIKGATDPFAFVGSALDASLSQATNGFEGYGQGMAGFGKRFGASYADQFDSGFWGNAVLPSLLKEDPRYYRLGKGPFMRRIWNAILFQYKTRRDDGTMGINYSNLMGNLIAGGISNAYYPTSDRGIGLTFQRAATVTALSTASTVFIEFGPDLERKFFRRRKPEAAVTPPAQEAPGEQPADKSGVKD